MTAGALCPFADELAPRANLGRDATLCVFPQTTLGYLLCQTLHEELRATSVVEKWEAEVDSISIRDESAAVQGQ